MVQVTWLAQQVKTLDLKAVSLSPTVGKEISLKIFFNFFKILKIQLKLKRDLDGLASRPVFYSSLNELRGRTKNTSCERNRMVSPL